jgi:hypothetical protein
MYSVAAQALRRIAQALRLVADQLDPPPIFSFTTKDGDGFSEATIVNVRLAESWSALADIINGQITQHGNGGSGPLSRYEP